MNKPTEPEKIKWKANPGVQAEVLKREEREIAYGGSRGGGKTEALINWFLDENFINCPTAIGVVLRRNSKDLDDYINRCRYAYKGVNGAVVGTQAPVIKFPSGCRIHTGHLRDANSYEHYQGWNIQRLGIEEATQIPDEATYEKMISSVRSTIEGVPGQIFLTANPGGAGHVWFKARFVTLAYGKTYVVNPKAPKERQLTRIFIPATIDDNPPLIDKDPAYLEWLNNIKDEKLRKAWRYGDWNTFHGQFFDMWDERVHVIEPFYLHPEWNRYRSLDYGSSSWCSVGWWAVTFKGQHIRYREMYETGLTPTQIARETINRTPSSENIISTWADPSIWAKNQEGRGANADQLTMQSIADTFGQNGLFCLPANNDRLSGWANMKDFMSHTKDQEPRIKIFNTCVDTIRTLPGLVHSEKNVEDLEKKGAEDHCADEIRYYLMHAGGSLPPEPEKTEMDRLIDKITTPQDDEGEWDDY